MGDSFISSFTICMTYLLSCFTVLPYCTMVNQVYLAAHLLWKKVFSLSPENINTMLAARVFIDALIRFRKFPSMPFFLERS